MMLMSEAVEKFCKETGSQVPDKFLERALSKEATNILFNQEDKSIGWADCLEEATDLAIEWYKTAKTQYKPTLHVPIIDIIEQITYMRVQALTIHLIARWDLQREARKEIARKLNDIWQECGDDILVDEYGNHDESITKTKEEVASICLDLFARRGGDLYKFFSSLSGSERKSIIDDAFPYEYYGY